MDCIICTNISHDKVCDKCDLISHETCIKEWCAINPGDIIVKSRFNCPNCRNRLDRYVSGIDSESMDDDYVYILCVACCQVKQYCKNECSREIDTSNSLICAECDITPIRKCPRCTVTIEKIDGCNHVKCTSCNSHMCWICGGIYDEKNIYSHIEAHNSEYESYYKRIDDMTIVSLLFVPKRFWTKNLIMKAIEKNPCNFIFVRNRSHEFIKEVVSKVPSAFEFVVDKTDEICLAAVKIDGSMLKFYQGTSHEIFLTAVNQDPSAIIYINNPSEEICMRAVTRDGRALRFIRNQSKEVIDAAIKHNSEAFNYANEQDEELCLTMIRKNPFHLKLIRIENMTNRVCREAVARNPQTLHYVPKVTQELALIAVNKDPSYLAMIENPSPEVCHAAINKNPVMLGYIRSKFQTYDLCMFAVKQDFSLINDIKSIRMRMIVLRDYMRYRFF